MNFADATQPPTFTTARLPIRTRAMTDLEACLAVDRDPPVTNCVAGPWADPVARRAFVEERTRHSYTAGTGYWSIIAPSGFVGWVLLTPLDLHGPEIETGCRLVRAAWVHGYATEAARPVLDHALHQLGLPKVLVDIDERNTGSVGVARKLGWPRPKPRIRTDTR